MWQIPGSPDHRGYAASSLQTQYRRLAARRGKQRATVAVGHTILRMVYYLLNDPTGVDDERGTQDRAERDRQALERDVVRRLQRLGNMVVLHPVGVTWWRPLLCFSEHPGSFLRRQNAVLMPGALRLVSSARAGLAAQGTALHAP